MVKLQLKFDVITGEKVRCNVITSRMCLAGETNASHFMWWPNRFLGLDSEKTCDSIHIVNFQKWRKIITQNEWMSARYVLQAPVVTSYNITHFIHSYRVYKAQLFMNIQYACLGVVTMCYEYIQYARECDVENVTLRVWRSVCCGCRWHSINSNLHLNRFLFAYTRCIILVRVKCECVYSPNHNNSFPYWKPIDS